MSSSSPADSRGRRSTRERSPRSPRSPKSPRISEAAGRSGSSGERRPRSPSNSSTPSDTSSIRADSNASKSGQRSLQLTARSQSNSSRGPAGQTSRSLQLTTGQATSSNGQRGGRTVRASYEQREPQPQRQRPSSSSAVSVSTSGRRNTNRLCDFEPADDLLDSEAEQRQRQRQNNRGHQHPQRHQFSLRADGGQANGGRATLTASSNGRSGAAARLSYHGQRGGRRTPADEDTLSWYERLMPECLLGLTAPITGYESQLDHQDLAGVQLSEADYELLEMARLRRNRRIRRRLGALVVVVSLASAYFIYRGRPASGGGLLGLRRSPQGVRQVVGEMAHRLEDGFSKTIHDTMGK